MRTIWEVKDEQNSIISNRHPIVSNTELMDAFWEELIYIFSKDSQCCKEKSWRS